MIEYFSLKLFCLLQLNVKGILYTYFKVAIGLGDRGGSFDLIIVLCRADIVQKY